LSTLNAKRAILRQIDDMSKQLRELRANIHDYELSDVCLSEDVDAFVENAKEFAAFVEDVESSEYSAEKLRDDSSGDEFETNELDEIEELNFGDEEYDDE
jgi:hypothetical protein